MEPDIFFDVKQIRISATDKEYYESPKGFSVDFSANHKHEPDVCDVVVRCSPTLEDPAERKFKEDLQTIMEQFDIYSDNPSEQYLRANHRHFIKQSTVLDSPNLDGCLDFLRDRAVDAHPVFIPYSTIQRVERQYEKQKIACLNTRTKFSNLELYRNKLTGEKFAKMIIGQTVGIDPDINRDLLTDGSRVTNPGYNEKEFERLV